MTRRAKSRPDGFLLAPLLYMLALAGIGAAVMFSGYSQILRSNAEMTAINAARSQLQAAAQTLSASAVLDTPTSTIVQPPAVLAFASVAAPDTSKLPTNYASASTTGSPHDTGVIDPSSGVRQLDPWGKYYVYCRWENLVSATNSSALKVFSAGPDGVLDSKCGDTTAVGDDRIITSTVAETYNRANVWQVSSSSQVKFGLDSNAVRVNQDGSLAAASLIITEPSAGQATILTVKDKGAVTRFTVSNAGAVAAASYSGTSASLTTLGTTGAATVGGTLGVTGATTLGGLSAGASALASLTLTTPLAVAQGGTGAITAAAARTNLGSTATGDALFIAATAGAARTTLGSTATGDALFIAATAGAARTTLGSTATGDALFIAATAAAARTTLGLGTMATQNANAVAITGGTITGVDLTGSSGGVAGSVAAGNITGCCVAISAGGTGANNAGSARTNLGTDDATNLTTGTLNILRLATSGVTAGTYNQVTVDTYGRVTSAANVPSITQGDTSVAVSDSGANGTVTITNDGVVSMVIDHSGNVGIGTATPGQKLDVNGNVQIRGAASSYRTLYFTTLGSSRWAISANNTPESGANVGSDFVLNTYTDAGAALGSPLTITRSSGNALFTGAVTANSGFIGNITGNVTGNVTGTITGAISLSDGSANGPGLYFTNDTNTGVWRPGADVFGISAGGKDVARFAGSTTAANYFNFTAQAGSTPVIISAAGTDTDISINITPKGAGNTLITQGSLGIGTSSAGSSLDVGGTSNSAFVQNLATWGLNAREQGLIIMPEGTVKDDGAGNITFGGTVIIMNPLSGSYIRVAAGTYALGGWGALWAPIPPTNARGSVVTPTVLAWSDGDRNYDGRDRVLLAQRMGGGQIMTRFSSFSNITGQGGTYFTTGNVGIGTTSPTYALDVDVPENVPKRIRLGNTASTGAAAGSIPVIETFGARGDANQTFYGRLAAGYRRTDGTAIASGQGLGALAFGAQWGTDTTYTAAKMLYSASIKGIAEGSFTAAAAMPTALTFYTGSTGDDIAAANLGYGTERMRINSTGYVGIGTATMNAMLDVYSPGGTAPALNLQSPYGSMRIWGGWTDSWGYLELGNQGFAANNNGFKICGYGCNPLASLYLLATNTYMSGNVGIGIITPAASAVLDVTSVTQGFLPPRMTTAQRNAIASPATGLVVFNSSTNLLNIYNGTTWAVTGNDGTVAFSFPAGSAGAPGLYVTGDPDTGFYQATANTLSVTAGGFEAQRWNTAASAVNYLSVTPSATLAPVQIGASGSDTNIGISLLPKGTGNVQIATGSLNVLSGSSGLQFNGANAINYPSGDTTAGGSIAIGLSALATETAAGSAAYAQYSHRLSGDGHRHNDDGGDAKYCRWVSGAQIEFVGRGKYGVGEPDPVKQHHGRE